MINKKAGRKPKFLKDRGEKGYPHIQVKLPEQERAVSKKVVRVAGVFD